MPKNSRILLNCRFFASNTLHSFCNLAVILINFLAKNGLTNPQNDFFSCKECLNKISAQNSNFEQKQLQRHLGPYILKSLEHVGMFKTYQKVKKQVWFYPAMLLIVSCPLLQTVSRNGFCCCNNKFCFFVTKSILFVQINYIWAKMKGMTFSYLLNDSLGTGNSLNQLQKWFLLLLQQCE